MRRVIPTMPDWITAVAAVAALAAAVWAGRISLRLLKNELGRDEVAAQRARRAQASGIAAWCVSPSEKASGAAERGILVHNSSDSPVFDVEVQSMYARKEDAARPQPPLRLAVLPPGQYVAGEHQKFPWSFPLPVGALEHAPQPIMNNPNWRVTRIAFTDAYGVKWTREDGRLNDVGAAPDQRR